jgi:hypothetical protein
MEVSGRAEPPSLGVQCTPLGLGQPRQRSRRGPALIRWGQVPPHQRQNTVVARHRGKQSPSSEVKNSFFCRGYRNLCFFIGEASLSPPHRTLENPKVARPGTGRRGGDAPSMDSSTLGRSAVVLQGPSVAEGPKEPAAPVPPLSGAVPSAGGRATVEILEAAEEESVEIGIELLRSAPRFGSDPVPELVLPGAGAVEVSSTPMARASNPVVGASKPVATEVVVDPSPQPPWSRWEPPSMAEPRRRRRHCVTPRLLRGWCRSANRPVWPRRFDQPSSRPGPSCRWGATQSMG